MLKFRNPVIEGKQPKYPKCEADLPNYDVFINIIDYCVQLKICTAKLFTEMAISLAFSQPEQSIFPHRKALWYALNYSLFCYIHVLIFLTRRRILWELDQHLCTSSFNIPCRVLVQRRELLMVRCLYPLNLSLVHD